jgi:hypothetical protein
MEEAACLCTLAPDRLDGLLFARCCFRTVSMFFVSSQWPANLTRPSRDCCLVVLVNVVVLAKELVS